MIKGYTGIFCAAFLFILILNGCKEKEIYPVIPSIEYKSAYFILGQNGKDSVLVLGISFKDGDGDIGLTQEDTFPPFNPVTDSNGKSLNPYYYNLYISYFEMNNGVFQNVVKPFTHDTIGYEFRIQNLTPDGRHKAIRGEIDVTIEASLFAGNDTTMYSFYIYDRALHKSNEVASPPIIWKN